MTLRLEVSFWEVILIWMILVRCFSFFPKRRFWPHSSASLMSEIGSGDNLRVADDLPGTLSFARHNAVYGTKGP